MAYQHHALFFAEGGSMYTMRTTIDDVGSHLGTEAVQSHMVFYGDKEVYAFTRRQPRHCRKPNATFSQFEGPVVIVPETWATKWMSTQC